MKLKELIRRLREEREDIPENLEAYLEDFVPNTLLKSGTLQQAFELSFFEMEEIYSEAYRHYEEDELREACNAFRWLVLLNPFVGKYWIGLAASLQLLEKYEKALHAYAISILLEGDNPFPHFHAFQCYEALGDREEAIKALRLALGRASGKPAYQELEKEIEALGATWDLEFKHNLI